MYYFKIKKRKGMTLVELLVALSIFAILSLAVLDVFTRQLRTSVRQRGISKLQTDFQSALSLLRWDILMAGYGIPSSQNPLNGTNGNPDTLYLRSVDPPVGGTGKWTFTLTSNSGAGGSKIIVVRRWNDARVDIGVGDVITAMPDTKTPIANFPAQVTALQNQVYIGPSGDTVPATVLTLNKTVSVGKGIFVFVLPQNQNDMNINYRLQNGQLLRNGLPVVGNVEDFEVAYWYDKNENYQVDAGEWRWDISALSPIEREKIRLVKASMVVLGERDMNYTYPDQNIKVEDHQYTLSQEDRHYRRRIYTITTKVRNVR